ncbi:MAG TPA: diacylglycerol kinase family protein [Mycobacteriales bacterium]|nr:diacylglycerol kinase family protein [Mycobacteriales bacterium]
MRALLVVNPKATATSVRVRDVLARALGSDLKVDVVETQRRGHAIELGARATDEGFDLVVALGGDGTVNELVNGILRGPDGQPGQPRTDQPALAVVPGGSTNVFSRALDIPRDPVEATSSLLDALREGRSRWIALGRAGSPGYDERWFTFTAGIGLDADAVQMVERARAKGKPSTPSRYTRATLGRFFFGTDRRHPALTLEREGHEPVPGLFLGIVSNTTPWTYFRSHPVTLAPQASFESGLDLVAMRRLHTVGTLWTASGMLTGHGARGRSAMTFHDLREFRLVGDRPMHFEVDGDYLGERESVHFQNVPAAIRVIC